MRHLIPSISLYTWPRKTAFLFRFLLAARTIPGILDMLLEDLGEPVQDADDRDGARAAVHLHQVTAAAPGTTRLDAVALANLPGRITNRLQHLELVDLIENARALDAVATSRAAGAELPPFGLCHSEFHPTSLHISASGWRLLDFARAFIGPGLLELASWHGTLDDPRPERTLGLIESYVAAGVHGKYWRCVADSMPPRGRWDATGSGSSTGSPSKSNADGRRKATGDDKPVTIWLNPTHGPLLDDLITDTGLDPVWCTSWRADAAALIGPRLGLPPWPHLDLPRPPSPTATPTATSGSATMSPHTSTANPAPGLMTTSFLPTTTGLSPAPPRDVPPCLSSQTLTRACSQPT